MVVSLSTCSSYDCGGHFGAARFHTSKYIKITSCPTLITWSLQSISWKHHFSWKLRVLSLWASSCSFCISLKSEGPLDNPTSICVVIWGFLDSKLSSFQPLSGRRLMQVSISPCESSKIYFTSLQQLDRVLRWPPCTEHVLLFESVQ